MTVGCSKNQAAVLRFISLLAAPLLLSPLIVCADSQASRCAFVVLVMAVYW